MSHQPKNDAHGRHSAAVSAEAVERALRLARLKVEGAERERFAHEFARVLASFGELALIDTSGVEPLHTPARRVDVLREDRPTPSVPREQLLATAPDARDGFFAVPKTIGGEG